MSPPPQRRDSAETLLAALLLLVVLGVAFLVYGSHRKQRANSRQAMRDQLNAIADLKVDQIARWRRELEDDARWVLEASTLPARARDFFANPAAGGARSNLVRWMESWRARHHYWRVLLVDTNLQVRLSSPAKENWAGPAAEAFLRRALTTNAVLFSDLHRDPVTDRVSLGVHIPLLPWTSAGTPSVPIGVLVFEIDPEQFLFATIQAWPTPSRTAETLLVRREGDEVVYLNELRHQTNTALKLRLPAARLDLPANRAVRGEKQVVEGVDYRGKPVLAALRAVPETRWFVVAKEDLEELYEPLRRQAWRTALLSGALLAAFLLGLLLLWRNREHRFTQRELAERTREEARVRALQQRLALHVQQTPLAVIEWDLDFRVTAWNPAAERIFGFAAGEALGRRAPDFLIPAPARPQVEEIWSALLRQQGGARGTNENLTKDGRAILCEWFNTPLVDAGGRIMAVASLVLDITERQRHEEERERLLRELESKNEELESLVYAASHDLRSPLVNIEGFSQRLKNTCDELGGLLRQPGVPPAWRGEVRLITEERIPKALKFVHLSVIKMTALIDGLLRVSRLGRVMVDPRLLDMNQLLGRVIAAQAFQIQQAGADVRVEPLPPCTGDAMLLDQVFSNLLDNALKYRDPARPLSIRISGRVERRQVIYRVADTGRGIAPAHQKNIWVLFHRLYPEAGIPGEGLGLNLVRRILHRHQGRIWVSSVPGEGSCFHVALPNE